MQFGYADGMIISSNILLSDAPDATGIYVWGTSRYRADPSQHVNILDNQIQIAGQAISLNGVRDALVRGNTQPGKDPQRDALLKRCERVVVDGKDAEMAKKP